MSNTFWMYDYYDTTDINLSQGHKHQKTQKGGIHTQWKKRK